MLSTILKSCWYAICQWAMYYVLSILPSMMLSIILMISVLWAIPTWVSSYCSVLCQVLCWWALCASGQYQLEYWQWRNTCRPLTLPCTRRQNWKRNWRRNSQNMKIQKKLKQNVNYKKGKTVNKQRKIYSSEEVASFLQRKNYNLYFFSCGAWCMYFENMKRHFKAWPTDARS